MRYVGFLGSNCSGLVLPRHSGEGRPCFFQAPVRSPHTGKAAPFLGRLHMTTAYRGPGRMLLCIDDSPAILEYERSLFENSGYTVITTTSPRQGLQLATMSRFNVVVLDYHMPEMSGHQVAREIRRTRPDTSLVMVSGSDCPEHAHADQRLGPQGCGHRRAVGRCRFCF